MEAGDVSVIVTINMDVPGVTWEVSIYVDYRLIAQSKLNNGAKDFAGSDKASFANADVHWHPSRLPWSQAVRHAYQHGVWHSLLEWQGVEQHRPMCHWQPLRQWCDLLGWLARDGHLPLCSRLDRGYLCH
jgi:hypothetical protein